MDTSEKHLIPYMKNIFACPNFWGEIEDIQAEEILSEKPDGSFLLHKSKNLNYLLRVSYKNSHFISHDHICKLDASNDPETDHKLNLKDLLTNSSKDSCDVEKALRIPIHRKNPFSLQKLTRAVIADSTNFQDVNKLKLPKKLQEFVQEYQCSQPWPKDSLPIFHCDDFLPELEIVARVESMIEVRRIHYDWMDWIYEIRENVQLRQFIAERARNVRD